MNFAALAAANMLVQRAGVAGWQGEVAPLAEVRESISALGSALFPEWYAELLTTVPLCGLEFLLPLDEPDEEWDGLAWVEWLSPRDIRDESHMEPGGTALQLGYLALATNSGTGDLLAAPLAESDDPPVYWLDHEMGGDQELLRDSGRFLVSACLSKLFRDAVVKEQAPAKNRAPVRWGVS